MFGNPRAFGTAIREKSRAIGMTQEALALRSGVTRTFLVDLESGKGTCQLGKSLTVAAAVGIRLADLNQPATAEPTPADDEPDDDLSHVPRF